MKKKLAVGILLGFIFGYLAFRGTDGRGIIRILGTLHYGYLVPAILLMLGMHYLRSLRWGILLRPLARIDQLSLFAVTSVGFLAAVVMPARLGELARPYLAPRVSPLNMSSALATIVIERIFDSFTIVIMFALTALFVPVPPWMVNATVLFLALVLMLTGLVAGILFAREPSRRLVTRLIAVLPRKWEARALGYFGHFMDGLAVVADAGRIVTVAALSFLIWVVGAAALYVLFFAFAFDLSVTAAFTVLVFVVAGITIPSAPGLLGNWHYFCVLALGLFGVGKTDAAAFALMHHFLNISVAVVCGLVFLPGLLKRPAAGPADSQ